MSTSVCAREFSGSISPLLMYGSACSRARGAPSCGIVSRSRNCDMPAWCGQPARALGDAPAREVQV
eukprot:7690467-Pyramimonas_sp.AAC.1